MAVAEALLCRATAHEFSPMVHYAQPFRKVSVLQMYPEHEYAWENTQYGESGWREGDKGVGGWRVGDDDADDEEDNTGV